MNKLLEGEPIRLEENSIFDHIAALLVGSPVTTSAPKECFLISDFGWSAFLNCCEDSSPAKVRPELINVRRGVPTNGRTNDRKSRIDDAWQSVSSALPDTAVLDRGEEYVPRCAMGGISRTEYFTSCAREFLLNIRFEIDHRYSASPVNADLFTSYRTLHRSLWIVQPSDFYKCCSHSRKFLDRARLGADVAAAKGYGWMLERGEPTHSPLIPERVCISLVAIDQRARWVAIKDAVDSKVRKIMLRSDDSCENCALEAIAGLPGKWLLIL